MSLTPEDIQKIAQLARLNLTAENLALYPSQLSRIIDFIEQMNQVDTSSTDAMAHPLDLTQRLRPDIVTEPNMREKYQRLAPQVDSGLYLVPIVIEEA
jgi:aspartyl-tRNA(Asn)/glutamyl-tRNA(Gln) amidotransferase subunit C